MKKIVILIISIITFINCKSGIDECSLFDPVFPTLHLKIVDSTGANLIENGTFKPEDITVKGDFFNASFKFVPENENNSNLNNSLFLSIPNQLTSRYTINLNETETVAIDFKTEFTEIDCGVTYYKPIEAKVKTKVLELMEFESLQYYIVIEL